MALTKMARPARALSAALAPVLLIGDVGCGSSKVHEPEQLAAMGHTSP